MPTATISRACDAERIVLYLEGELSPAEELSMEKHLALCASCVEELNSQKQVLRALDFAFEERDEVDLPEDFAKVVAVRAESRVSGLRCPRERSRALFLCAALFVCVLVGLGAEAEKIFEAFAHFGGAVAAVGGFVFRLTADVGIGAAVILRAIGSHVFSNSSLAFVVFAALCAFFVLAASRRLLRADRT